MYTQVSALIKSISAGRIYQQIIYQQVWVGQTHRGKNRLCQVVQVLVKKKYLITAYKPTWKEQVVVLCTLAHHHAPPPPVGTGIESTPSLFLCTFFMSVTSRLHLVRNLFDLSSPVWYVGWVLIGVCPPTERSVFCHAGWPELGNGCFHGHGGGATNFMGVFVTTLT